MKTLGLLTKRRFGPLFWTQFLGSLNDNFLKNAIVILITFKSASIFGFRPDQMVAVTIALFILPFFLLSAIAGEIADKFEKSRHIQKIKLFEIFCMVTAGVGFMTQNLYILLSSIFLMGIQSALFSPVKYGLLPQHLKPTELLSGNALIEVGTFASILIGTLLGGVMITSFSSGPQFVSILLIAFSVTGALASLLIPSAPSFAKVRTIDTNPWRCTKKVIKAARSHKTVFQCILGISWFWFIGAVILAQLPSYVKDYLSGNEHVITLLLAVFSIGIAVGAFLCDQMSAKNVELGLVPLGSLGMSAFLIDLYFVRYPYGGSTSLLTISEFLTKGHSIKLLFDLFMLAVFGGLYSVPLYTLVQQKSPPEIRSQAVAANNIVNSCFMVIAAIWLVGILKFEFTTPGIFLFLGTVNLFAASKIYFTIPEFMIRFIIWMASWIFFRVRVSNLDNVPDSGPAILVCNHGSPLDWIFISGTITRPIRFIADQYEFENPIKRSLFNDYKVIPIAGARENSEVYQLALEKIKVELTKGVLICVFPEGVVNYGGEIGPFRPELLRLVEDNEVPVVPIGIKADWFKVSGSKTRGQKFPWWKYLGRRVQIRFGKPIKHGSFDLEKCQYQVMELAK